MSGALTVSGEINSVTFGGITLSDRSNFASSFTQDIFGSTSGGYYIKEVRTEGTAPAPLMSGYASGLAWKGSDTWGCFTVGYNAPNIRFCGGNGNDAVWTADLIHSSNIGSQSVNYATSAGLIAGFASGGATSSIGWGNQTGTCINVMNDATGGSLAFRRDNPSGGQVSMIIDGTVYVNEGQYRVWSQSNLSFSLSGTTLSITTNGGI